MRARVLIAAALVTSLAAACSRPASEPAAAETESARDLALVPVTDEPAVVSALEAPAPPAPEPARAPAREVRGAPEPIGSAFAESTPADHAHADEPDAPPAPMTHPRIDDSAEREAGPAAAVRGGGKPAVPMTEGAGPVPDQGRGPILVRGGQATIDDDCALHMPPRVGEVRPEGAGVLINDRTPRRGPPQTIADRAPARGPGAFGGRGGIR